MSETAQQLEEIRHHLTEHDQRFDQFDAKLVGLDRKIGGLGVQIENVQSTVQLLAEQMSGFIRANSNVRSRVDSLEEQQRMTDLRLNVLEQRA